MVRVLVLGAAAGGGFPQWNSNSVACRRVRAGDPAARAATQASVAISGDGAHWFLINASPDLREQINREPALHPQQGLRSSPIAGVVLTNGDVDAVAGLLHLRERTPFTVYAHPRVLEVLEENPIFGVLAADVVERRACAVDEPFVLGGGEGDGAGLRVTPFAVPGKVALYREDETRGPDFGTAKGDTLGLEIVDAADSVRVCYVANCAEVDSRLSARLEGADLVFFDGTLWSDDEMIASGEGAKTGRRMGHVSMSGEGGVIDALADVAIGRRVFIHVNNTNPALLADSPERARLEEAGWEVAYDGMEVALP